MLRNSKSNGNIGKRRSEENNEDLENMVGKNANKIKINIKKNNT